MASLWEAQITRFINKVRECGVHTFIETGTHTGAGAHWAATRFDRVVTIEFNRTFYEKAKSKYRSYRNIEFWHGDSKDVLPVVMQSLHEPAMIWLDAHFWPELYEEHPELDLPYCGCPLKSELEAIMQSAYRHFILIDDTGYFDYRQPEWASDWPTIGMIRDMMAKRGYHTEVKIDQIAITPTDRQIPFLTPVEIFTQRSLSSPGAQPLAQG
jgi:hypothetical protein